MKSSATSTGADPGSRVSQRSGAKPDSVEILSGVFDDGSGRQVTTGTPIGLVIRNVDQRSKDYGDIAAKFRPGHADFTYEAKYGIRDYRGGGRSSARETAMRVAAGAIARKGSVPDVTIRAGLVQMGPHQIDRNRLDWGTVDDNPFFCPDPGSVRTLVGLSRRHPQEWIVDRRGHRSRRRRRARRPRCADLRQARPGSWLQR